MSRTGTFGGFSFDPEVFSDYMSEQPTWNDRILASGILVQDQTIMDLIGTKGNVATLPFYVPIDEDESHALKLYFRCTVGQKSPVQGNNQRSKAAADTGWK